MVHLIILQFKNWSRDIAVSGRSHEMREDSYISYFLNRELEY
jgi:hypothetical protein